MNINFVPSIPFTSCKGIFVLKLNYELPQVDQYNQFVSDHQPCNVVKLIINDHYCSLTELRNSIVSTSQQATDYFYLAVNKFLVYSTVDLEVTNGCYDLKLVEYCKDSIVDKFTLVSYNVRPDDKGTLGNFLHPVTTMFFKRND